MSNSLQFGRHLPLGRLNMCLSVEGENDESPSDPLTPINASELNDAALIEWRC